MLAINVKLLIFRSNWAITKYAVSPIVPTYKIVLSGYLKESKYLNRPSISMLIYANPTTPLATNISRNKLCAV